MRFTHVAILAVLLTTLAGCGDKAESDDAAADAREMKGRLAAPECGGGFNLENSQVILKDGAGDIIGTATTTGNLAAPVPAPCVVSFDIDDVPEADFYTITIGTHEGPAWSFEDLEQQDFEPTLALGDATMPTADPELFCLSYSELAAVFDDIDQLNDEPFKWNERLHSFAPDFEKFAAGLAVEGDSTEMVQVLLDGATALRNISATDGIKAMNRAIDPLNEAMDDLRFEFDCPYWEHVGYVPAD